MGGSLTSVNIGKRIDVEMSSDKAGLSDGQLTQAEMSKIDMLGRISILLNINQTSRV